LEEKEPTIKDLQADYKKSPNNEVSQEIVTKLATLRDDISSMLESAYDCQDVVVDTQYQMSDCQIPVNIRVRGNEIEQFSEKLAQLQDEFKDLK